MYRIIIILGILLTGFVINGCTTSTEGKETGIPYIIKEYHKIQQRQNLVKDKPTPKSKTDLTRPVVEPVMAQPPTEKNVNDQTEKNVNDQKVEKKVFLTFDDGPEASITPTVLDILDSYGVKATFFVIGTCVEKYPEILKDIVKRGHVVGNHTYNHRYQDLYSVKGGFLKSLKINEEVIYRTVGLRPYIVRDPGGKVRNNWPVRRSLGKNNYWLVEWNVDSYDSRNPQPTTPQIIENVRLQIKNPRIWSNMIILLHDGKGHLNTLKALPAIIEMLKNEGFSFEVLK